MPRKGQPGGQHTGRWVAYYRVSTDEQGRSGLGIDAQKAAVANHLNGGQWIMVAEFTEVESGKRDDRPELTKAFAACKKHKAKLVIAKLDRLSRNVHFISGLMDAGVEFVAADMPFANKLTVHIMAAFAQHERERISERTREALVAAEGTGRETRRSRVHEGEQARHGQATRAGRPVRCQHPAADPRAAGQRREDLSRDRADADVARDQDGQGRTMVACARVQHPEADEGIAMTEVSNKCDGR